MATNRIAFITTGQKRLFSSGVSTLDWPSMESSFEGASLDVLLKIELDKARKKGFEEALEKVQDKIKRDVQGYMQRIIRVNSFIATIVGNSLQHISIQQCRAKWCNDFHVVSAFFVIHASLQDELDFSSLLNEVALFLHEKEEIILEVFFMNDSEEIDYASLKSDYPFNIKTSPLK